MYARSITTVLAVVLCGGAALADCKCRNVGVYYTQGQTACVMGRLARCGMSQNVPNWEPLGTPCPTASVRVPAKPAG